MSALRAWVTALPPRALHPDRVDAACRGGLPGQAPTPELHHRRPSDRPIGGDLIAIVLALVELVTVSSIIVIDRDGAACHPTAAPSLRGPLCVRPRRDRPHVRPAHRPDPGGRRPDALVVRDTRCTAAWDRDRACVTRARADLGGAAG